MGAEPTKSEEIVVRAPVGAQLALERAAVLARLSPSELARRFVLDGLKASGFDVPDVAAGA